MRTWKIALGIMLFSLGALPSAQAAPSFSCRGNLNDAEAAICSDPQLSDLDREMADIYNSRVDRAREPERSRVVAAQRAWLRERDDCGSDKKCLRSVYRERTAALSVGDNAPADRRPPEPAARPRREASAGELVGAICTGGAVGDEALEFRNRPNYDDAVKVRRSGPQRLTVLRATKGTDTNWVYVTDAQDHVLGWTTTPDLKCNTDSEMSCSNELAGRAAEQLVSQCNDIQGAEAACNARKPCRIIIREVARKCLEWRNTPNAQDTPPDFCKRY